MVSRTSGSVCSIATMSTTRLSPRLEKKDYVPELLSTRLI